MRVSRRWLLAILLGGVAFLELMHLFPGSISHTVQNRFDLNAEANIPTWYATLLLYSVALAAFMLYLRTKSRARAFWLVFALTFAFFSADEAARLHEILDSPAVRIKWIYLYAPAAAAFLAFCAHRLLWRREAGPEAARWILGGLLLYGLGSLGMEAISHFAELSGRWLVLSVMVEEGLEMVGTIGVLAGCLIELEMLN